MRPYNGSESDYKVITDSVAANGGGVTTLASIQAALAAAGIAWPANFNSARSPDVVTLDKDICRAWGR